MNAPSSVEVLVVFDSRHGATAESGGGTGLTGLTCLTGSSAGRRGRSRSIAPQVPHGPAQPG